MQFKEKLKKRAKRKYINTPVLNHLIGLNSPLKAKYTLSHSCSSAIEQKDGKLISRYCKRMWCTICAPIRTAVRLNNYKNQLENLENLQLTTLTIPNVPFHKIKHTIKTFRSTFRQFRDTYNKSTGTVFKGVYNFEVTFNNTTKLFHPHIHIIHEGLEVIPTNYYRKDKSKFITNDLINYWVSHQPTCKLKAQDTRPCTDLIEGFKYSSKSVFFIKKDNERKYIIPVVELDQLYQQLKSVRCFQPFGIAIVSKNEDQQLEELTAYETDLPDGVYLWDKHDWYQTLIIETETGEILSHYKEDATHQLIELSGYKPTETTKKITSQIHLNENYAAPLPN